MTEENNDRHSKGIEREARCRLCGYGEENHEKYCLWTTKSWEETPKRYVGTGGKRGKDDAE